MPEAETASLEVAGQFVQKVRVARLDGPAVRNALVRVVPSQVEAVERLDNAHSHQLRPDPIRRRSRELDVPGQHARQLVPRRSSGNRGFVVQNELGLVRAARARHAHDALAERGVAGFHVVHGVFRVGLESVLPVHDHPGLAEERGLAEKVLAGLAGQIQVDLFQVPCAVVAGDAAEVQAQQHLAVRDRELVDRVRPVDQVVSVLRVWIVLGLDEVAREVQGAWRGVAALAALRQQLGDDLGVGPIQSQPLAGPIAEQVLAVPHPSPRPEQILEVVRPALDEFLAADQAFDQQVPLPFPAVGFKAQNLFQRGDTPD